MIILNKYLQKYNQIYIAVFAAKIDSQGTDPPCLSDVCVLE